MKCFKKLVSLLLVLTLTLGVFPAAVWAADDDYKSWEQGDSRWGSMQLGTSDGTVASHGCLVTSITKLLLQAGIKKPSTFDIADFVTKMNSNGGLSSIGTLQWAKVTSAYPSFKFCSDPLISNGTYDAQAYYDEILKYIRQGYHMAVKVPYGSMHWVAVDESRSLKYNKVFIMDSRADKAKNVGITLEGRYDKFYLVRAYTGGTTPDYCHCTEDYTGWYECVKTTNLRSGHGTAYEVLDKLSAGDRVYITKGFDYDINDKSTFVWGHTTVDGQDGYVRLDISNLKRLAYTISYDANGGSGAPAAQTKYHEEDLTLSSTIPTRSGYYFAGWATSPSASSGVYSAGDVYSKDQAQTLYAVWSKTPIPTTKKIVNTVSGVHVYWNAASGAERYALYRSSTGSADSYEWIAGTTATHYTDTDVKSGRTYYYKVACYNSSGVGAGGKSPAISITHVSTPDITLRVNRSTGIGLGWDKIPGATGYAIYRKSYSGTDAWTRVATIKDPDTLSWTDTSVADNNGTVYRYTIRALAGEDHSILSGCRNTGRTMARLTTRTLSSAVKASAASITCKWITTSAADGYEVRFLVDGEIYKTFTVGNYKTGTKTFTALAKGKTYDIQVRSYKKVSGVGTFYSAWSAKESVTL